MQSKQAVLAMAMLCVKTTNSKINKTRPLKMLKLKFKRTDFYIHPGPVKVILISNNKYLPY